GCTTAHHSKLAGGDEPQQLQNRLRPGTAVDERHGWRGARSATVAAHHRPTRYLNKLQSNPIKQPSNDRARHTAATPRSPAHTPRRTPPASAVDARYSVRHRQRWCKPAAE